MIRDNLLTIVIALFSGLAVLCLFYALATYVESGPRGTRISVVKTIKHHPITAARLRQD